MSDYMPHPSPFAPSWRLPRFTLAEAEEAYDAWRFNCGPSALCAIVGLGPHDFSKLPAAQEFRKKGYTNPTLMDRLLRDVRALGLIGHYDTVSAGQRTDLRWPSFGLARVQWGGPWTKPGVPMAARYRQTHWVACWHNDLDRSGPTIGWSIFDCNAMNVGGWIRWEEWAHWLAPAIIRDGYPHADGSWWCTHAIEVGR